MWSASKTSDKPDLFRRGRLSYWEVVSKLCRVLQVIKRGKKRGKTGLPNKTPPTRLFQLS
jgi:hypothetical protein